MTDRRTDRRTARITTPKTALALRRVVKICRNFYCRVAIECMELIMATLRSRCGHYIFCRVVSCIFFFFYLLYFPRLWCHLYQAGRPSHGHWPTHILVLSCFFFCLSFLVFRRLISAVTEWMSIAQLCRAVSSQLRHISAIGTNLLSSNTSSTCPPNMVNFGSLKAKFHYASCFGAGSEHVRSYFGAGSEPIRS